MKDELDKNEIKYYEPKYGLSVWLDFTKICNDGFDAEKRLYHKFLNEYNLSLAPGECFGSSNPGYFRLCFTVEEDHTIISDCVNRISQAIN